MLIPRPDVMAVLRSIISPSSVKHFRKHYSLIAGSHGVRKTTAVCTAAKEIGSGVIYFEVPSDVNAGFAIRLGATIGFNYDEISVWQALKSRFLRTEIKSASGFIALFVPNKMF
jgi:hypothetical protein